MDNPAEEQRKRTRRPRKKKNVIVENLTAQLSASCTIEDSLTKTTTVQVETLSVVLQNKSHINTAGTIDENSQQNPNIVNTPRKIAKVISSFS